MNSGGRSFERTNRSIDDRRWSAARTSTITPFASRRIGVDSGVIVETSKSLSIATLSELGCIVLFAHPAGTPVGIIVADCQCTRSESPREISVSQFAAGTPGVGLSVLIWTGVGLPWFSQVDRAPMKRGHQMRILGNGGPMKSGGRSFERTNQTVDESVNDGRREATR